MILKIRLNFMLGACCFFFTLYPLFSAVFILPQRKSSALYCTCRKASNQVILNKYEEDNNRNQA